VDGKHLKTKFFVNDDVASSGSKGGARGPRVKKKKKIAEGRRAGRTRKKTAPRPLAKGLDPPPVTIIM